MPRVSIILLSIVWCLWRCNTPAQLNMEQSQIEKNEEAVMITQLGAKGDGVTDDRAAIQEAFQQGRHLVFPKGDYLIRSKTRQNAFLYINELNYPKSIEFEEGARLILAEDISTDVQKISVIMIQAEKGNIENIDIRGLYIEGNRHKHKITPTGLLAYENVGFNIEQFKLSQVNIQNMGGGGIHTQALYNDFTDIKIENCGKHGIGIINTTNFNQTHYFYLDNYTSIDNGAYCIDFSGKNDPNNPKKALPSDQWEGKVTNVTSIRSNYGIKTAGYWDLELDNVIIRDAKHNGFFLSKDALNKKIVANNIKIINAKDNGLFLAGKSSFEGKNILIEACGVGLTIKETSVVIDSLSVDGQYKNIAGIRMGNSSVKLSNFVVKNNAASDTYTTWVNGKDVMLENGLFIDNASPYEILIKESAEKVTFKNLNFMNVKQPKQAAIMNTQKYGKSTIIDCDFTQFSGKQIIDKTKTLDIKSNKE